MNKDHFTSQIISNSLFYASEEMGIALRNSSYSPNIKERMDHSAAILDKEGRLLAQAEHIPVHLGSLPWGIRNTIDYMKSEGIELLEGCMVVVNNPYIAGTHLNDITLLRPVFYKGELVCIVANKAHHSDIGGKIPGSISTDAKTIFEEGLIINPVYLILNNEFRNDIISLIASNSRNRYERLGDIRAQAAANFTGERRIIETIERFGLDAFIGACNYSFEYSEKLMMKKLELIKHGTYSASDFLEAPDGNKIKLNVKIQIEDDKIGVDYTGTDKQVSYPLNAVLGVTIAGVHFVFKSVLGKDIPVNHGAFKHIEIKVPAGTVLNPFFPAPVAGGNLETSQRNADVLLLALSNAVPDEVPAASGGSMNSIMMGGSKNGTAWAFYETIGVGLGACKGLDGSNGIHANMTNTMNTPIEEIERNMPIIMRRYELRVNSSGAGEFRGGTGIVRSYMVSSGRVTVTVLSDRGKIRPWGLNGGKQGAPTEVIVCKGRKLFSLGTKKTFELSKDEWFEIRTAGGGGYGNPRKRRKELVLLDIESGLITKKHAAKYYGIK